MQREITDVPNLTAPLIWRVQRLCKALNTSTKYNMRGGVEERVVSASELLHRYLLESLHALLSSLRHRASGV